MDRYKVLNKLKNFRKVINLDTKSNQHIIKFDNGKVFQSFETVIAIICDGETFLTSDWEYSRTTSKYLNKFLAEDKTTIRKKLLNGDFKYVN